MQCKRTPRPHLSPVHGNWPSKQDYESQLSQTFEEQRAGAQCANTGESLLRFLIPLLLVLGACSQTEAARQTEMASDATLSGLDWLAGYWLECDGASQTAEAWVGAGSDLLVGVNHARSSRGASFEYMRIGPRADGRLAFFGSPGGAPAVAFALISLERQRAVFENPDHDFPQRIIYAREGDRLIGRVEGETGGQVRSLEWRYEAARFGEDCPRRR